MALTVRPVESNEYDTWDEFVAASLHGTLFHTSHWKQAMDACLDRGHMAILGCFDGHQLAGGCVFLDRTTYRQRTAVTPLLTPYSGFVLPRSVGEKLSDRVSRETQVLAALGNWMHDKYAFQSLVNPPHFDDARPLQQAGYRLSPRFTYCINLKLLGEELWARLDGSVKRQIRKAQNLGFTVSDYLDPGRAYELYRDTFRRHSEECPVRREMFDEIVGSELLRDHRQVYCVHLGEELISYIVLLSFQQTLYYALASTAAEHLSSGVSSYLVWEVIRTRSDREWNTLDFVGANVPSIARFKEGFNPQLVTYYHAESYGSNYVRLGRSMLKALRK